MASEPVTTDRDAALRRLLIDRVEATAVPNRTSTARSTSRHPLGTGLVTAFVSIAVVAVSATALVLGEAPHTAPAGAPKHGTGPDTGLTTPVTSSPTPTTPDPSPSPVAPSPAQTTTAPDPAPSGTTQLITHAGWHDITRDQLHSYVVATSWGMGDPTNGAIWEEQAWLDKQCMASKGYLFDPISVGRGTGTTYGDSGLTPEQLQGYQEAMYGPSTDAPYDWRTAGCHGLSVHETGQDNAH
ncbi:MAG TPA: hypothetical protein VIG76_08700 [Amnibacterium sp.]|jgi:hypothetical protein|uniref:hypothetical protein n=1 Tax=Amnibacterium sp. TaxID=1872496 RepID=UPI002F94F85E